MIKVTGKQEKAMFDIFNDEWSKVVSVKLVDAPVVVIRNVEYTLVSDKDWRLMTKCYNRAMTRTIKRMQEALNQ